MIENIIRKLVYLLLIIYPSGLLLRFRLFQNVYLVPQDIVVCLIFILTVFFYFQKQTFPKNVFYIYQICFIAVGIVSLIVNSFLNHDINFLAAALYAGRYLIYISLIVVPGLSMEKAKIKKGLIISGLTILTIGFWQYFFYFDLYGLFYLGWDNHLYRLFSTFLDPNFAGVFFVLLFFLLFGKVMTAKFSKSYKQLIFSFFSLVAVFLTFSRTALISLVIGTISIGIYKKKYTVTILVLIVLVFFLAMISDMGIEGLNPLRTSSTGERIDSMREAAVIISKNPIFGVGFNAYRYAQLRYGYRNSRGASVSNADAGTDNSFLFALATSGLIGFVCYVVSFIALIRQILVTHQEESNVSIAMVAALFSGSLFTNLLFYTPLLTFLFLVIAINRNAAKDYT